MTKKLPERFYKEKRFKESVKILLQSKITVNIVKYDSKVILEIWCGKTETTKWLVNNKYYNNLIKWLTQIKQGG